MRMIGRREAIQIIRDHGWGPSDCTISHHKHLSWYGANTPCESFDSNLGIHDQYAIIDVKNWLGY